MPSPYAKSEKQKAPPAATPPAASAQVVKVAQIYAVRSVKAYPTGDLMSVVQIGDADCAPHAHGLRAPIATWVEIVAGLAEACPHFAERLRARI